MLGFLKAIQNIGGFLKVIANLCGSFLQKEDKMSKNSSNSNNNQSSKNNGDLTSHGSNSPNIIGNSNSGNGNTNVIFNGKVNIILNVCTDKTAIGEKITINFNNQSLDFLICAFEIKKIKDVTYTVFAIFDSAKESIDKLFLKGEFTEGEKINIKGLKGRLIDSENEINEEGCYIQSGKKPQDKEAPYEKGL